MRYQPVVGVWIYHTDALLSWGPSNVLQDRLEQY